MALKFHRSEWPAKLEAYDAAGVKKNCHPSDELRALVRQSTTILSSHLQRAIESAHCFQLDSEIISSSLFCEAPLPRRLPIPVRCSTSTAALVTRLLWFMGYSAGVESYHQACQRALNATQKLITQAQENQRVVLFGHGIFNRFIGKQLLRQGWVGPRWQPTQYWSHATYRY